MTSGEETEGELRRLLKICPWYEALSEGDITNTGILSKSLNLLSKVAYKRELYTDWAEYMSLLPAVQSRLLGAAVLPLLATEDILCSRVSTAETSKE